MSRLGLFGNKIDAIREQRGLTPAGFRADGTDPEGATKEAMLARMYRRADQHLPPGIGGVPSTSTTDVDQSPDGDATASDPDES